MVDLSLPGDQDWQSVFLCHSSKDKPFVRRLAESLRQAGKRVWLDEAEIRIGQSLIGSIGRAIAEMDYFCIVLSSHSLSSEWVQRELGVAMQREFAERKVVVLPVILERVELPPFLADKKYGDFSDERVYQQKVQELLDSIESSSTTSVNVSSQPELTLLGELEQALGSFVDVRIIGVDENLSHAPDESKQLMDVYLRLSAKPSGVWIECFREDWSRQWYTMLRRAWISSDSIVIHCVPDEIERYHYPRLKQSVEGANRQYRNLLELKIINEKRRIEKEASERNSLKGLNDRLGLGSSS